MRERHRKRRSAGPAPSSAAAGSVIYGWHSAVAALANPRRKVLRLLATRNAHARLVEFGLVALPALAALGAMPEPVEAREIERLTGAEAVHQGIAILVEPLPPPELAALAEATLVVVLDQVTDPHNVGAILRSAAAFGAGGRVLTDGPADSGVLAKAASGALEHVPLVRVTNLARALAALGAMGFRRLGLDSAAPATLASLGPAPRNALVLGAEGKGLRRLTREHCDAMVRLDLPGPIKSLNVSNAAALALAAVAGMR
jgi:23S rRNA (guanosine2251-2'-O)-methyltransferase